MTVLVTGGAGYIGAHVVRLLLKRNYKVVILDNLSRGHKESIPENVPFEKLDLNDYNNLLNCLDNYSPTSVIHFAAFAYVGESVINPQLYYNNNVIGSLNLFSALKEKGIDKIVFSSTCSLYGNPDTTPIPETAAINPINPYAKTKSIIENALEDYSNGYGLQYTSLRYFNAAGASLDGEIGESHDPEPHLIPSVLYTALGKQKSICIYGDDYPTKDGTCIRDYIHVEDLADAHVKALEYLQNKKKSLIVNLGTGEGNSVKEVIALAGKISGKEIDQNVIERRPGDPAVLVADNKLAMETLNWKPKYGLEDIITSAWNWHANPKY